MAPGSRTPRPTLSSPAVAAVELEVQVVHGALDQTKWPVAVGHVTGMPLRGAEGWLDARLGGRLSDRLLIGAYPEQEGAAVCVPAPDLSPPGVLVLGLGPGGEVTADKVARAMTAAVLQWAADQADALLGPPTEPVPLGVAAALVGANPLDGISLEDSVAAVVDGVVAAEVILRSSQRLRSRVRVAELEIIELYRDRAQAAARALRDLQTPATASAAVRLKPRTRVARRAGGRAGQPPDAYSTGAWWRVEVRGAQPSGEMPEGYQDLEFTSLSRRASADRLVQRIETGTVEGLVGAAVMTPRPDEQLGNTLFELLVPDALKPKVLTGDNIQVLVDPITAAYPWEALATEPPGTSGEPHPALRGGMLRQFAERDAQQARFTVRRPTGSDVLVIANPPAGDLAPDLPGAVREGRAVANILARTRPDHPGYQVHALIWEDGQSETTNLPPATGPDAWPHIINALYRYEYRIVHIAAHGAYNPGQPAHSGILIGANRYLTAATIGSMPVVPELVFLNCCHSGRVTPTGWDTPTRTGQAHHLAASIARALILLGVRAVVAAGWAVDDHDATAFAETLYSRLLDNGEPFGNAVTQARRAATTTNTWAAYQCYGDPGYRLRSLAAGTDT